MLENTLHHASFSPSATKINLRYFLFPYSFVLSFLKLFKIKLL